MPTTLAVRPSRTEARPSVPAIRVRPVPPLEPPTDEELGEAAWQAPAMGAPALPLDLTPATRPSRRRAPGRAAGTVDAGIDAGPGPSGGPDDQPEVEGQSTQPSPSGQPAQPGSPGEPTATAAAAVESPARAAARRFLATCLEVVGGFRPVTHLRPLCVADGFLGIAERLTGRTATTTATRILGAAHFAARTPVTGRTVTGAPPRAGRSSQTAPGERVIVRRVQLGEPIDGVAEVAVVLSRRDQVWAMALRLEDHGGRWLCAHLEVL